MKAQERGDTSSWFGLPRWFALSLFACLLVGAGFLLWSTAQSFTRSNSLDERRARALNIAADYISKWPEVATTIAQTSLYYRDENHRNKEKSGISNIFYAYLFHPDFGDFKVEYDRNQEKCQTTVNIYKNQLTVNGEALRSSDNLPEPFKTYIKIARSSSWIPLGKRKNPVCFMIENLDLAKVAPPLGTFSHLLLIADTPRSSHKVSEKNKPKTKSAGAELSDGDKGSTEQQITDAQPWRNGRVVAWVGSSELPIRRLSDLPALQSEVSNVVAAAEAAAGASGVAVQSQNNVKRDALEPFDSKVAGKSYRFYWRPIAFDIPGNSTDVRGQTVDYYLVGVAPSGLGTEQGQSHTELLAFAVVLFMLIALIPVVKLALLGPVDSMQPIEVAAIGLGIAAATALATGSWIGVRDVLVARSSASSQLTETARALTRNVERDLRDALFGPQMNALSLNFDPVRPNELVAYKGPNQPRPFVVVENTLLLDDNGRQAADTIVNSARDHVGANLDLSDRVYFTRAAEKDFAPTDHLATKLGTDTCNIWRYVEDGLVFDQIRSRADGAPKTIVAAKLKKSEKIPDCSSPFEAVSNDERLQPSAIVATFVTWRMIAPRLDTDLRYAVVDLRRGATGRPVLFHSDAYRAGVELFDESLDAGTRAKLSELVDHPVPCGLERNAAVHSPQPQEFAGIYEGEATLFAVDRIPCTDWAVVTFKTRRFVDTQALRPAVQAILVWASLAIFPYLIWMALTLAFEDRAWVWLWPDPTKQKNEAYRNLAYLLIGSSIIAVSLVELVSPFWGFVFSSLAAFASLGWLGWVHYSSQSETRLKLDHSTERRFRIFAVAVLVAFSVVPVAALAADARGYFAEVYAAEDAHAHQQADDDRLRLWSAIARMQGATSPTEKKDDEDSNKTEGTLCANNDNNSDRNSDTNTTTTTAAPVAAKCPRYFTQQLRNTAGYERGLELVNKPPTHWIVRSRDGIGVVDDFTLISLALVAIAILGLAIWATTRGLFGFGVALEAIDYPQLPLNDDGTLDLRALPPRFLVICANESHLQALKTDAEEIDLNDAVRNPRELKLPAPKSPNPLLLLVTNLGLLLGDPNGRRQALGLLERIVAKQKLPKPKTAQETTSQTANEVSGNQSAYPQADVIDVHPRYLVAILTSLTPLERVLQSFDRERDEMDQLGEQERLAARLERAKHREDMRWSALFEEFTTYYYAAHPRPEPQNLSSDGDAVVLIWRELEYLPDGVVAAMICDRNNCLTDAIVAWARRLAARQPERGAIIDFLTSNLIEHYHLVWSLSSRAERLLLYRIAHGHVPNLERAYALRSLVKRGLVVLDPYPRTMNQSFAQFVRHVEKPETIKNWRRTQEHGFWDGARLLFGLALPAALGLLILAAVRNGESITAIVPLIVAAIPALIHALGAANRTAVA